ncbi:M55 family metallopeptidase [Clostridium tunisiense]|uniref:M55 family metallopeptidase n=1 Tax=Clostridium tunisiense TaxID=219748 RepID=UPI0002FF2440|nr:M55 family metallopeptidase [Clostridium tunisiense]
MKIFISADIEGTTGVVNWDETEIDKEFSKYFCEQMTREVNAACEGAISGGAEEIFIKDAHGPARNINPLKLPESVKIMRGWARNPLIMMAGLDETFQGVIFTGYHSAAGENGNPLAHTLNGSIQHMHINGEVASEFLINAYTAAYYNVPVLFLSGDKALCQSVKKLNKNIKTVAVSEGLGQGSISIHPNLAITKIKEQVYEAVKDDLSKYIIELPKFFSVEVKFKDHFIAYKGGFYPGATHVDAKTIKYEAEDYMDVLKFIFFAVN